MALLLVMNPSHVGCLVPPNACYKKMNKDMNVVAQLQ